MLLYLSILFWMILDPVGNVPLIVGLMGSLPLKRQLFVIFREMLIALGVMILALFFGESFFYALQVDTSALAITGGIILFLIGIKMVFSEPADASRPQKHHEPFIVPLAIPAIAGPGILAAIILYAGGEVSNWIVFGAICISWLFSLPVVLFAPWIKHIFGVNGAVATERLFGYLVVLIAVQMMLRGWTESFLAT